MFRARLKRRMRFCENLLDKVLPFAAAGSYVTNWPSSSTFPSLHNIKHPSIRSLQNIKHLSILGLYNKIACLRIYNWLLCDRNIGSLQFSSFTLQLPLRGRKMFLQYHATSVIRIQMIWRLVWKYYNCCNYMKIFGNSPKRCLLWPTVKWKRQINLVPIYIKRFIDLVN